MFSRVHVEYVLSSSLSFFCSYSFLSCSSLLFNAENERESMVVVDLGISWCPGGGMEKGERVNEERRKEARKKRRQRNEEGEEGRSREGEVGRSEEGQPGRSEEGGKEQGRRGGRRVNKCRISTHNVYLHWQQESAQLSASEIHLVSRVERENCDW